MGGITTSEGVDKIAPAMCAARVAIRSVEFNKSNHHDKYDYADISAHIDAIEGAMERNGLFVSCSVLDVEYGTQQTKSGSAWASCRLRLAVRVTHSSGQWMQIEAVGEGRDAGDKAAYKATTGARKYGLACMFNLRFGVEPERDSSADHRPAFDPSRVNAASSAPKPTETIGADRASELIQAMRSVGMTQAPTYAYLAEKGFPGLEKTPIKDLPAGCIVHLEDLINEYGNK